MPSRNEAQALRFRPSGNDDGDPLRAPPIFPSRCEGLGTRWGFVFVGHFRPQPEKRPQALACEPVIVVKEKGLEISIQIKGSDPGPVQVQRHNNSRKIV